MPTHGHRVDVDIAMDVDIIDFDIAVSFQSPARVTHTHTPVLYPVCLLSGLGHPSPQPSVVYLFMSSEVLRTLY